MIYNYYNTDRIDTVSLKTNMSFMLDKVKKIYPLYILSIVASLLFYIVGEERANSLDTLKRLILNIFLIQEWIPLEKRSIVVPTWYLCTCVLLYLLFPYVLRMMEKKYNTAKACLGILISIIIEVALGLVGKNLYFECNETWANDVTAWFVYFAPFSRVWDAFIGCNLGYLFLKSNSVKKLKINYTALEILVIVQMIITLFAIYIIKLPYTSPVIRSKELWWTFDLAYLISTSSMVYVFAVGRGKITKLLSNRYIIFIAEISAYAFIIHDVVLRYLGSIYYHIPGVDGYEFYYKYGIWINLTIGLVITLVCSFIWARILFYYRLRKIRNINS